jgi:hypothetical protein
MFDYVYGTTRRDGIMRQIFAQISGDYYAHSTRQSRTLFRGSLATLCQPPSAAGFAATQASAADGSLGGGGGSDTGRCIELLQ